MILFVKKSLLKFGQFYNYALNAEFVDAVGMVGMLRRKKITIRKLKQFYN